MIRRWTFCTVQFTGRKISSLWTLLECRIRFANWTFCQIPKSLLDCAPELCTRLGKFYWITKLKLLACWLFCRNPEFNENLAFYDISEGDLASRSLHVLVVDDDQYGHDYMGEVRIKLAKLLVQNTIYVSAPESYNNQTTLVFFFFSWPSLWKTYVQNRKGHCRPPSWTNGSTLICGRVVRFSSPCAIRQREEPS